MCTELKKSYFVCNNAAVFYLGSDNEMHKEDIGELLSLHGTNHSEFEKFLTGINNGSMGMCQPGEYLYVDTDAEDDKRFKHIPAFVFKKLIKDPDTIRLRHKLDDVILLQYNPEAITV